MGIGRVQWVSVRVYSKYHGSTVGVNRGVQWVSVEYSGCQ